MTEFWLLRHGQTEWNVDKRLQGQLDSPLTPEGREQAAAAGRALREQPFAKAWCSPAGRARHTAALVAEAHARPLAFDESPALAEMHFGEWEGHTKAEILERWGPQAGHFWHAPHEYVPFGGETFARTASRVVRFLETAASHGSPQLVVTHGMVLQLLLHTVRGGSLHRLYDAPFVLQASLTRVVVHPGQEPTAWDILEVGRRLS